MRRPPQRMKSFKNVPVLRGLAERATGPGGIVDNEKKYLLRRSCRLPLFLIVFFLIYGSVHGYALLKAKSALGFGWGTAAALAPVLIALTFAPLIIYFLGRHGMEEAARAVSWIGYTWGGLLFFFFWMNLAADALHLVARLGGALSGRWGSASLVSVKAPFLALVGLSVALGAYSYFQAGGGGGGGGGVVCSAPPRPRLGKYAVTGNHEFYAGIDQALSFTRRAGFSVLRGETAPLGNILRRRAAD